MSLISGIRGFSVTMYGQSGIAMDWFGLNDPFTQQLPLKITNTYSGTLWFQGTLVNPRSGYYNYSGIQMGSVNSGASTTLVMTWDTGVSGWIVSSSPITDNLALNITTFTSSNYGPSYSSGNFTTFNTLFNRYSGVIKVFGDIYSNDQPTPSLALNSGGSLPTAATGSNTTFSYVVSYILSGWESDVGTAATLTTASGFGTIAVSWNAINAATQYYVWRFSGSTDFGTTAGNNALSGTMDLMAIQTTNSFTDTGVAPLRTGYYRNNDWYTSNNTRETATAATYLSPPQSRTIAGGLQINVSWTHSYHLSKNASGINLLGPFYGIFHTRANFAQGVYIRWGIATSENPYISGTILMDNTIVANELANVWYRVVFILGASGTLSASGKVAIQENNENPGAGNDVLVDDVFIVAQS